jgi:hypothetical protein
MEPSDPAKRFVVGTEGRDNSIDIKVSGSEMPYSLTVGETQLLAGHVEEAHAHATGALALACRECLQLFIVLSHVGGQVRCEKLRHRGGLSVDRRQCGG